MTRWGVEEGWNAIEIIVSRFQWVTDRIIRFINESNIDCLLEICSHDPEDKIVEARYLKLLSSVKVDNLFENMHTCDSKHLLLDREPQETRDVLERIIRMNQHYKTELVHAMNIGPKDLLTKMDRNFSIFD